MKAFSTLGGWILEHEALLSGTAAISALIRHSMVGCLQANAHSQ